MQRWKKYIEKYNRIYKYSNILKMCFLNINYYYIYNFGSDI